MGRYLICCLISMVVGTTLGMILALTELEYMDRSKKDEH